MFHDFSAVLDDLKRNGERFDAETLKLLSYPDLHRAATGDAGDQACELELVETERDARLAPWLATVTRHTLQAHRPAMKDAGVFEDVALRLQAEVLEAMPAWNDLSPEAHAYFLIRCLRSHVDDPFDRITRLQAWLDQIEPKDPQILGLKALLRMATDEMLEILHSKATLDIKFVRRRFRGFEFLTKTMTMWEQATVASMTLKGYSCTAGCFSSAHED